MAKQKKYTLDLEENIDFEVFGISTPFADYRLAWELNHKLEFKFEKSNETIPIYDRKTKQIKSFQQYYFFDDENLTEIHLLKNKQGNNIVTTEHAMLDFFLIFKNNFVVDSNQLLSKLRNTNGIVAAFRLESENFDFIDGMN